MLKINSHKMNLDLTVMGYIRVGQIACPTCGGEHGKALRASVKDPFTVDPLYGEEARGQHCDTCGTPLMVEQVTVAA